MGIGQAITMPLFSAPTRPTPPGWLQAASKANPLSYEMNPLRYLLIGLPTDLWLDVGALTGSHGCHDRCGADVIP
jgi:ABC-2 type transport system permease protein